MSSEVVSIIGLVMVMIIIILGIKAVHDATGVQVICAHCGSTFFVHNRCAHCNAPVNEETQR